MGLWLLGYNQANGSEIGGEWRSDGRNDVDGIADEIRLFMDEDGSLFGKKWVMVGLRRRHGVWMKAQGLEKQPCY
ncbi:hypothetical protein TcasGA2_TC001196 [Tribolium castaneum]|uniref:Uncharacterized protein n=1 Tax=Tribolium castaneum TaxID=7070 RepID=D6WAP8_TRICA|nr:hypothetical protein TcasGA2_TC001196 [Tribolium castaneum]